MNPYDPRSFPSNPQENREFLKWLRQKAKEVKEQEGGGALWQQQRMLRSWDLTRPKMWDQLLKLGPDVPKLLALVLDDQMWKSDQAYLKAGMSPPDSYLEAAKEWLLLEPEEWEE